MDEVEKIVNSIGALAETLGLFYNELIRQGLPSEFAFELTRTYLIELYNFWQIENFLL